MRIIYFLFAQSWEAMDGDTATFTPDITPLILAELPIFRLVHSTGLTT